MNLNSRNLCVLVAATLTLLFCTSVFAQGPADLTVAGRLRPHQRSATAIPDAPAPIARSGAWSGVTVPDRKHRR